jgi:hypothetical protein
LPASRAPDAVAAGSLNSRKCPKPSNNFIEGMEAEA